MRVIKHGDNWREPDLILTFDCWNCHCRWEDYEPIARVDKYVSFCPECGASNSKEVNE